MRKVGQTPSAPQAEARLSDITQLPISPPQPPSEEKINGILLGFRIRYRELLYDRLRGYSAHAVSSISAWADLTGESGLRTSTWMHQRRKRPFTQLPLLLSNTLTKLHAPVRADYIALHSCVTRTIIPIRGETFTQTSFVLSSPRGSDTLQQSISSCDQQQSAASYY